MNFSWAELINEIAKMYISGLSESEISSKLAGSYLSGCGEVERVETDSTIASPFIQLNMPRVEVPHRSKFISGNFLALNFSEKNVDEIGILTKGNSVSFKTRIIKSNGPFAGVGISEFDDEKEISIMLGTEESEIA